MPGPWSPTAIFAQHTFPPPRIDSPVIRIPSWHTLVFYSRKSIRCQKPLVPLLKTYTGCPTKSHAASSHIIDWMLKSIWDPSSRWATHIMFSNPRNVHYYSSYCLCAAAGVTLHWLMPTYGQFPSLVGVWVPMGRVRWELWMYLDPHDIAKVNMAVIFRWWIEVSVNAIIIRGWMFDWLTYCILLTLYLWFRGIQWVQWLKKIKDNAVECGGDCWYQWLGT